MDLSPEQAVSRLRAAVTFSGSQKVFAFKVHCSEPYLSDVLQGKRPLGPKILSELKLEMVTTTVYREKE